MISKLLEESKKEMINHGRKNWKQTEYFLLKGSITPPPGELWKVELLEDIRIVAGVPTAMRRTMKDVQLNASTELDLQELQYCGELANELFEPGKQATVAADPIWQLYCTLSGVKECEYRGERVAVLHCILIKYRQAMEGGLNNGSMGNTKKKIAVTTG